MGKTYNPQDLVVDSIIVLTQSSLSLKAFITNIKKHNKSIIKIQPLSHRFVTKKTCLTTKPNQSQMRSHSLVAQKVLATLYVAAMSGIHLSSPPLTSKMMVNNDNNDNQ